MERANDQARQPMSNGVEKDARPGKGSTVEGAPRDAGKSLPEPALAQSVARAAASAVRAGAADRGAAQPQAGTAAGGEDAASLEEGPPGPVRITDVPEPDEKIFFQSAYAQLLARQAWTRRKVTVANLEDGIAVSIRDPDLEGIDEQQIAGLLEQECRRSGSPLIELTVNGRLLKAGADVETGKTAGQRERE
jgi:hypothetical protein